MRFRLFEALWRPATENGSFSAFCAGVVLKRKNWEVIKTNRKFAGVVLVVAAVALASVSSAWLALAWAEDCRVWLPRLDVAVLVAPVADGGWNVTVRAFNRDSVGFWWERVRVYGLDIVDERSGNGSVGHTELLADSLVWEALLVGAVHQVVVHLDALPEYFSVCVDYSAVRYFGPLYAERVRLGFWTDRIYTR
jgi:hypothetical protein